MLDILRAYCDVDGDKSDSTRSSQRVQQAWIDFASATDARRGVMPQKLLLHVMQLSSHPLQEPETAAVSNTAGSMIVFSIIILMAMLVERLAVVARRFLTFRIRKVQLASTGSPLLSWYPIYLVVCPWQSTGIPSKS